MRADEALVALLLEALHDGAQMRHNAAQSNGEWDFDLVLANGEIEPVEVTVSTDRERQQIYAAILSDHGSFIDRRVCQYDWYVTPHQNANIRRIRKEVDRYLAEVEHAGVTDFFDGWASSKEAVRRICMELRIEAGTRCDWKPPGRIGLGLPGNGGTLSGDIVVEHVEREASKEDNRKKLGRSQATRRHLAVVLGDLNGVGKASMLGGFFPEQPAALPPEITAAWLITRLHGSVPEYLVWRNVAGEPWEDLGVVTVSDEAITERAG